MKNEQIFSLIMPLISSYTEDEILKEKHILDLLEDLCRSILMHFENRIFIDCGAYEGIYSKKAAPCFQYVIALEPEPTNYYKLVSKTLLRNVLIMRYAVCSYDGEGFLYLRSSTTHSFKNLLQTSLILMIRGYGIFLIDLNHIIALKTGN